MGLKMNTLQRTIARMAQFLADTLAALTGLYYSKKYAAIVKRLGLAGPGEAADGRRGFIIIQIDGLSHEALQAALEAGIMPHTRKMLERGHLRLSRWRCGLPSTTPAAQAGILFGNNEDIPGYRWYDKRRRTPVVAKSPNDMGEVQARLSASRPGILQGGLSSGNVFDGDASVSLSTLGAINERRLFESVRGLGFLMLFLLNPWRALRMGFLSVREYVVAALERIKARFRLGRPVPLVDLHPWVRVFSNVILSELQTFAVQIDIYRGTPAIYSTYYGYDETAHHHEVSSTAARRSLRDIDAHIHQIDRLRRARLNRDYDLYILSDHGLTPAHPFAWLYGETLGQFIARQIGKPMRLAETDDGENQAGVHAQYLLEELRAIEANLGERGAIIAHALYRLAEKRLTQPGDQTTRHVDRANDIVVRNSGSLSHVYFNVTDAQMELSQVMEVFPELIPRLVLHEGIWLVAGREGNEVVVIGKEGILRLGVGYRVHGQNPLRLLPEPEWAADQIRRLLFFPHSGDLIVFGHYDPATNTVVSFEEQWAAHGGLGGPQDYPFIMYPDRVQWDFEGVRNAEELYGYFASRYGIAEPLAMSIATPIPAT